MHIPRLALRITALFAIGLIFFSFFAIKNTPQAQATTETFTTPGDTSWTAPAGVTSVTVEAWGGGGEVSTVL